ncbi:MAG: isoprenyl transferase [Ekhidna sp.]|nr:isoprenyl transferase [Ekhidna sp.]
MEKFKNHIDTKNLPRHIAVIMDGNGRWAQKQGAKRLFGHQNAVKAIKNVTEASAELGVEYLTLFVFSTENWERPKIEVDGLMSLLMSLLKKELPTLLENNIKLSSIGATGELSEITQKRLKEAIDLTSLNTGMELILALNYSGKWDLIQAINNLLNATSEPVKSSDLEGYLSTSGIPEPELLIRTGGEMRISNFMLWQLAYSELYFTNKFWPDFRKKDLYEAIISYQKRERRFGKTSDQVNT